MSYFYYNALKRTKYYQEHPKKYLIMQTLGANRVCNRGFEKGEWGKQNMQVDWSGDHK